MSVYRGENSGASLRARRASRKRFVRHARTAARAERSESAGCSMAIWPDARNKPPHQTPEWSRRVKYTVAVGPHAECHLTDALTDACEAEAIYTPPISGILLVGFGSYARTIVDRHGSKVHTFWEVMFDTHWMRQWHRLGMTSCHLLSGTGQLS